MHFKKGWLYMACIVFSEKIVDAFVVAIKNGQCLQGLISLVKNGGDDVYADQFYNEIGNHPEENLVREKVPQLF